MYVELNTYVELKLKNKWFFAKENHSKVSLELNVYMDLNAYIGLKLKKTKDIAAKEKKTFNSEFGPERVCWTERVWRAKTE